MHDNNVFAYYFGHLTLWKHLDFHVTLVNAWIILLWEFWIRIACYPSFSAV